MESGVSAALTHCVALDMTCPSPSASVSPDNLHSPQQLYSSPPRILFSRLDAWACLTWGRGWEAWCSQLCFPRTLLPQDSASPGLCFPRTPLPTQARPSPQGRSTLPQPLSASGAPALTRGQKPAGRQSGHPGQEAGGPGGLCPGGQGAPPRAMFTALRKISNSQGYSGNLMCTLGLSAVYFW